MSSMEDMEKIVHVYSSVGSKDGHHGLSFETKALKRDKFSDVSWVKIPGKGAGYHCFEEN